MSAQQSVDNIKLELKKLQESGLVSGDLKSQFDSLLAQINTTPSPTLEYVEAIYAFQAQQAGDLNLNVGDKIQILEKISKDWYKGKSGDQVGVFPSNYVKPASMASREQPGVPTALPQYSQAVVSQQQQPIGSQQTASSSSSYQAPPFPPQSTNYYQHPQQQPPQQYYPPPQQQPMQQPMQQPVQQPAQQEPAKESMLSGIGGKLGNAFVFGAGATLGGDLVNSIF